MPTCKESVTETPAVVRSRGECAREVPRCGLCAHFLPKRFSKKPGPSGPALSSTQPSSMYEPF